jgi:WD40 repeat protein
MTIGHKTVISGVAATDSFVATAGYDNRVILWEALTRRPLRVGLHDHLANQVEFSPCKRFLLSTSSDYTARLWRIPDLSLEAVLGGHRDDIEGASFNPVSPLIATASYDDTIGVYDFTGRRLYTLAGHRSDVNTVFWKDCDILVSSGDDGTIRYWSHEARRQTAVVDTGNIETDTVCNGPADYVYCGNDEGEIVTLSGTRLLARSQAHRAGIKRLVYIPSRRQLISSSYDGLIKLWQISLNGELVNALSQVVPPLVWPRSCAHLHADTYAFATFGSSFALFDASSGAWVLDDVRPSGSRNAILAHGSGYWTVGDAGVVEDETGATVATTGSLCNALVGCGTVVLTGGQLGKVFDAATGNCLFEHHSPINGGATSFAWQGRPAALLGTYTGELLHFVDAGEGATFKGAHRIASNSVKGVAIGAEVGIAMVATGEAIVFDPVSFRPRDTVRAHHAVANGCVLLPAGGFASVGRDKQLVLWTDTGGVKASVSTPHEHSIRTLAATTGHIVTGDYRGTLGIYSVAQGKYIGTRRISETGISCVAPASPGTVLATSYDGQVHRVEL